MIATANSPIIYCKKCGMPLKKGTKICSYCQQKTGHHGRAPKEMTEKKPRKTWIPWVSIVLIILNALAGLYKLAGGEFDIIYHGNSR